MSVRRLAEPSVQPASFAFDRAKSSEVRKWIRKYPKGREQSAVIPLLMLAQEQEGWVTKPAIEHIADMLDMPYIRALEVATFYTQFQLKPVGTRAHIQVCGTTPCMLRGSEALIDVCRSKIHPEQFHTNAAGTLSWEEVECLGACANAPMVMIFKDTYEDLTPERLGEIVDQFEAGRGASVPTGPQNGRVFAAPETGLTSLTNEKAVLKSTREKETKPASRPVRAEAAVPPSNSAKPKTDAPETSPAVRSPTNVKASVNGEKAASVRAPKGDDRQADKAEPSVEGGERGRRHSGKSADASRAFHSPETLQGDPIGAAGKRRKSEAVSAPVKPTPEGTEIGRRERGAPAAIERPARPDDLKLISGVGPKIEDRLNSLGVYTYAQVAAWKRVERDWVDGYLNFKGRIERDDWIKQAKALAKGGEAEYIRVFGKKPR